MNTRVERLSISESDPAVRKEIAAALGSSSSLGTSVSLSEQSKRRRSSVASAILASGNVKSGKDNTSNGKVAKRKRSKRGNQGPLSLKIAPRFLQHEVKRESNVAKSTNTISIKFLRDFVQYLYRGKQLNVPLWIDVEGRNNLNKLVVLFMPGLEPLDFHLSKGADFDTNGTRMNEASHFTLGDDDGANNEMLSKYENFPVLCPGSKMSLFSAYNAFLNVPLTKNEKTTLIDELSRKKIDITDLFATLDQLVEQDYPIHPSTVGVTEENKAGLVKSQSDLDVQWVNTEYPPTGATGESHIYGLDCEMCMASTGLVVTRVSLVDFQLNVIYDELVKPDIPIIDYLTKYSGITKEMLDPVTRTLSDVQEELLKLVNANDVLVGHSLQSDFNVLHLRHPRIVDTAIIFDHKAGPPFRPSLRYLAQEYLHSDIQSAGGNGHNPIEDARTAIQLLKLKISKGLAFGSSVDTENLFRRLGRLSSKRTLLVNDSVATTTSQSMSNWVSSIRCNSDKEIMDHIVEELSNFDIFVGRLRDLEFSRGYAVPSLLSKREVPDDPQLIISTFMEKLRSLYEKLPSNSMILLLSGAGDTKDWTAICDELNKIDAKEDKMKKRLELGPRIEEALLKARDGVGSIIVKGE
ncbi:Rnh70p KNAG_0K00230 [Huiozyma naganishii CBS 8797]|uniref:Exonuclease domain-containing protein n=1 Tax=Huiozyma naganishii (strain ATCC MYA-139 / BCRC 22969 / CBS 8797 / KCTC 17520 / NBRC 10181 / NCYC 3082 / Yp74L-3) TaxID=1071383 RepID=J7SAQ9_HUIN7|nr:hypothetical protein KNAG_0K00230 [Kazachstania naganishii CBS 8797]CCK72391.1 hypothetical protein KNAG_0K00230 [Kazachstania naganishii CBS 8797]